MAINKKSQFEPVEITLADLADAISHPARIAILKVLAKRQTCICGEIVEVLPLAQATVSQHLKALKQAGLITGEVEGVKSCYCINWPVFEAFAALFKGFESEIAQYHSPSNCC